MAWVRNASPTTAKSASWPAIATPKADNARPAPTLRAAPPNAPPTAKRPGPPRRVADHSRGTVTFATDVETIWLPSKHVETSTLAAYRSYSTST